MGIKCDDIEDSSDVVEKLDYLSIQKG